MSQLLFSARMPSLILYICKVLYWEKVIKCRKKEGEKGTRRASDKVYFALEGRTWRLDGGLWPQERAIVSPLNQFHAPPPVP